MAIMSCKLWKLLDDFCNYKVTTGNGMLCRHKSFTYHKVTVQTARLSSERSRQILLPQVRCYLYSHTSRLDYIVVHHCTYADRCPLDYSTHHFCLVASPPISDSFLCARALLARCLSHLQIQTTIIAIK